MGKNRRVLRMLLTAAIAAALAAIFVAVPGSAGAHEPADSSYAAAETIYVTSGGWHSIGGRLRYFHSPGEMAAGEWVLWEGNWHYLKANGVMATGEIVSIDGITYAFDSKGACILDADEKIWWFFKSKGLGDHAVAGIMGNLHAESLLNPQNLQDRREKQLGYSDISYTLAVDDGTYAGFAGDSAGYGLAQWTSASRKRGLLNFAQSAGASVGDIDVQLAFIWEELSGSYSGTLGALRKAKTIREASDIFMTRYEGPANQSAAVKSQRASFGKMYYDRLKESQFNSYNY